MTTRVLPVEAFDSIDQYIAAGGGSGLTAARAVEPGSIIAELEASGLRGRGGAGFPTGTKWRTIVSYASSELATPVVVNAAEGEPGTFKDRSILMRNPYAVIEGALIAGLAVEAREVVIATKARFADVVARLRSSVDEVRRAGWADAIEIDIIEGPDEYLYGEETALLEVLDGRQPFPRIAPPWRRGLVEVVESDDAVDSGSGLSAEVEMATSGDPESLAPPVLVDNVETLANVPGIIANGAAWFRSVGTSRSPGTIVCTVTGAVNDPGVFEVDLGTSLRSVIELAVHDPDEIGHDRPAPATPIAVLMGASNAVVLADRFDTPITYEDFAAIGGGLGSASFIVIGDDTDPVAVAAGVSRFLAVESCGQCTPCKQDGLEISHRLGQLASGRGTELDLARIDQQLVRITDGARCNLAAQHQVVIASIRAAFADHFSARTEPTLDELPTYEFAELLAINDGTAIVDPTFPGKQPDWTFDADDSGQSPADRLSEHRS